MRKPDTFTKTIYVVAWAGCEIPLSGRTFYSEDEALKMAAAWVDHSGIRVERMRAAFVFDTFLNQEKILEKLGKNSQTVV